MLNTELHAALAGDLGHALELEAVEAIGGGCIARSQRLRCGSGDYFLKQMPVGDGPLLAAEADALAELAACDAVRVPQVLARGCTPRTAYLLLEYIPLRPLDAASASRLGTALAQLHRIQGPAYGWPADNWIGASPQENGWLEDWVTFFWQRRLLPQRNRAEASGLLGASVLAGLDALRERLPHTLRGYRPQAALLHGDLWGGNVAADPEGRPVLYDPASYYGDAETDLAMTRLFGSLPAAFYRSYDAARPPSAGRAWRMQLYDLYHLLNHLNLFGSQYAPQVGRVLDQLLKEPAC